MIGSKSIAGLKLCAAIGLGLLFAQTALAEDTTAFYEGRTLNLVAGFNVGGGADTYARLIARHLRKHIAGNPLVVVRNMPGAGSMVAANHVFNLSPKDGSEIGLFAGNIAVEPVIGGVPAKYDARKFNWIGAPAADTAVCIASIATAFKTFDDVFKKEMVTGAAGTSTLDFPIVLNSLLGTRLKLVRGYSGSAGLRLALERGEIEGFCGVGLSSLSALGLTADRVRILVQIALRKDQQLPNVPLVMDYARSDEQRQIMRLLFGWRVMERPLAAPPGVPADRVAMLREGFDATMRDADFVADVSRAALALDPMSGRDIAALVEDLYRTPPAVARRAAELLGRVRE
jgi:tripartite-type tricarboxylate transporter receptor subunit TctC